MFLFTMINLSSFSVFGILLLRIMSCKGIEDAISRSFAGAFVSSSKHRIRGQAFKSVAVPSSISCSHACLAHSECVSTNYEFISDEKGMCHLYSQLVDVNEELEKNEQFEFSQYISSKNPCLERRSCNRVGRCEPRFFASKNKFVCRCIRGYAGAHCEIQPGLQINPALSCKVLRQRNPLFPSAKYWVKLNGSAVEVYCDMATEGGGWTLVWSYTFTRYSDFGNPGNAVTPFPTWPASGVISVPRSTRIPLSETQYDAMEFSLWKDIGSEFLIKSNINNWISCKRSPDGNLVTFVDGGIKCKVVKRVSPNCNDIGAPNILKATETYGPSMILSPGNKQYYYFEGNTASYVQRYPAHHPCGTSNQNQEKGVSNPHGNIFIR